MNIEIVSGSPRSASITNRVAVFLQQHLSGCTRHNVGLLDVREWNFPQLQQEVYPSVEKTPDPYKPLAERMFAADAFILVSPEYNGSYTPALKSLFDHFPKQLHKPFGICTASPGAYGGIRATQQMQLLILALFGVASPYMLVVPQVEKKFSADGQLTDAGFEHSVNTFVQEYLWLAERLRHN